MAPVGLHKLKPMPHGPKPMQHRLKPVPPGTHAEARKGGLGYSGRLEFGVGVRANFAVQIDFFVLRGDPFHGRSSLRGTCSATAQIK